MFFSSPPRQAETTMTCHACQGLLLAKRSCHEAYLYCPSCHTPFTITEYRAEMDTVLEDFLEAQYSDRV